MCFDASELQRCVSGRNLFHFVHCVDFVYHRTFGGHEKFTAYISCLLSARKDKAILKHLSRLMPQLAAIQRVKPTRRSSR